MTAKLVTGVSKNTSKVVIIDAYLGKVLKRLTKNTMEHMEHLTREMYNELQSQLEKSVIDGLERKGFKFETTEQLHEFIKTRCHCEDRTHLQEKTYLIDGKPFLVHNYKMEISPIYMEGNQTKIEANGGYYRFV